MGDSSLTRGKVGLAFALAILVDIIQIPANIAFFAATLATLGLDIPGGVALDLTVDTVTACVMSGLLGFHWALLPTFVIELIPGIEMAPTWTGCVAYVCHVRKKQGRLED